MMQVVVPLISAAVGAIAALSGVLLKLRYDNRADRNKREYELEARFLPERRAAFDEFLKCHREQVVRIRRMRGLALIVRDGGVEPSQEDLNNFPPSRIEDMASALDTVKRLARSYAVIRSADHMVHLQGDLTSALDTMLRAVASTEPRRKLSKAEKQQDDMLWFVLENLLRDRELEFIHAYRAELGIGDPNAGPSRYPIEPRPRTLDVSEHVVRSHIIPLHLQPTNTD